MIQLKIIIYYNLDIRLISLIGISCIIYPLSSSEVSDDFKNHAKYL